MSIDQVIGKLSSNFLTDKGVDLTDLYIGIPIGFVIAAILLMVMKVINDDKKRVLNGSDPRSVRKLFNEDIIQDIVITVGVISMVSFGLSCFTLFFLTDGGKEEFVNSYVKGIETKKVELREFENNSVVVRDVINKKNDKLYADVWVSEKDKKMGAFISHMKIVRDLESGDSSYVTYKKITKSIKYNGKAGRVLYKKGWAKAELHVPQGLKNYEIADHVKASISGTVVD